MRQKRLITSLIRRADNGRRSLSSDHSALLLSMQSTLFVCVYRSRRVNSWDRSENAQYVPGGCIRWLNRTGPVLLTTVQASCDLFLSRIVHGIGSSWTVLNWGSSGECIRTAPAQTASGFPVQSTTLHLPGTSTRERHGIGLYPSVSRGIHVIPRSAVLPSITSTYSDQKSIWSLGSRS